MRIVFCAPFPVEVFKPNVRLRDEHIKTHPCSWIKALSTKLAENAYIDLHIITMSPYLRGDQTVHRENITYHLIDSSLPLWLTKILRLDPTSSLWATPLLKMRAIINKLKPDIVHGHGTESCFSLMAVYSGFPNIISIQGIIAQVYKAELSNRSRIVRHFEEHTIRKAKYINTKTVISEKFVEVLSPKSKRIFIEAPINEIFWSIENPPFTRNIFYVGPLIKRKGIGEFVDAYILLKKRFSDTKAYIIGAGSREVIEHYKMIADTLGMAKDLVFTGQLDHKTILDIYANGGVYCLTSHVENSPNVIMEAMAAGLPVVASDVGAVRYLMDDKVSGFIIEKGSAEAVATAVEQIFKDEALYYEMGARGKYIASSRWKSENIAQKHLEMYRYILNEEKTIMRNRRVKEKIR